MKPESDQFHCISSVENCSVSPDSVDSTDYGNLKNSVDETANEGTASSAQTHDDCSNKIEVTIDDEKQPVIPQSFDDSICYVDKSVVEPKLPEIVVCTSEKSYQVVRDICVDDRVMSPKSSLGELLSIPHRNSEELSKNESNILVQDLSDLPPSKNNPFLDYDSPSSKNPFLDEICSNEEEKSDLPEASISQEEAKLEPDNQNEERESDNQEEGETDRNSSSSDQKDSIIGNLTETQPKNEVSNEFELNIEENSQKRAERLLENQVLSSHRPSHGERTSLSGLITYSGPITHAGSLSVRSDSSTTSTRSFAFPILQPEWNSSPVRMAKAERKHRRRWRHSLFCCRF